jgi:hypothetical protein
MTIRSDIGILKTEPRPAEDRNSKSPCRRVGDSIRRINHLPLWKNGEG